jgi:hypothetical protein
MTGRENALESVVEDFPRRATLASMTDDELHAIERRIAQVDRAVQARKLGFGSGEETWRMLREAQEDRRSLLAALREATRSRARRGHDTA